jgi:hypothetical protein
MGEFTDGGRLSIASGGVGQWPPPEAVEGQGAGRWPPESVETDVPYYVLQQRDAAQRLYNARAMEIAQAYDEGDEAKLADLRDETVAGFLKRMGAE